jgi:hypothetical protein
MNRISLVFGVIVSLSSPSEAVEFVCPKKILTTQRLDKSELGWTEFVRPDGDGKINTYSYVSGISIYWDDPKKIMELVPDNESAIDPSWSFKKAPPGTPPLYMACNYFQTRIGFVKALPINVKKCTAKRGGILQCDVFKP